MLATARSRSIAASCTSTSPPRMREHGTQGDGADRDEVAPSLVCLKIAHADQVHEPFHAAKTNIAVEVLQIRIVTG